MNYSNYSEHPETNGTWRDNEWNVTTWYAAMVSLAVFGTFNNLLILLIIVTKKQLRTGSGFLIAHLVVVYCLVCMVHAPVNAYMVYTRGSTFASNDVCSVVQFFYLATVYVSNWTEVFLALNRFVAIQFPHLYSPWTRNSVILTMLLLSWLFGIAGSLPGALNFGGRFQISVLGQCFNNPRGLGRWFIAFGTYLPYGVIAAFYVGIVGKMVLAKIKQRQVNTIVQIKQSRVLARRMAVARMLVVSFLWCCLCNMPVTIMVSGFPHLYSSQPFLNLWLRLCLVGQFALNPLIFYAMNDDYRDGVRRLLNRYRNRNVVPTDHPSSSLAHRKKVQFVFSIHEPDATKQTP